MRSYRYLAIVTNIDDPEMSGRIKVRCPDLLGDADLEFPDWICPVLDWGWFYVPDIDEIVEIEVLMETDEDDVRFQSAIYDPVVRWRGKRFYGGQGTDAPRPIPSIMTEKNYGKRRGIVTPSGQALLFDDTKNEEEIRLEWSKKVGDEIKKAYLKFIDDGIQIENKNGSKVILDSDSKKIRIEDESGNKIILENGKVTISTSGEVDVDCAAAKLNANSVELSNGATEAIVKGSSWLSWAASHTHISASPGSPSGVPVPPPTGALLSTKVKTG